MTWLGQRIQLHNADDQTSDWMSRARTPQTRARIRHWSRVETIGVYTALVGLVLLLAAPIPTIVLAVWFDLVGIDRTDVYWWIWGIAGGLSLAGAIGMGLGSSRRREACFSDGHLSIGRVERVTEHPGSDDDAAWYELRVSTELSDGVILRRKVYRDGADPRRRTGRPIRFRHNTLDPDDLHDVLFDGWPDQAKPGATGGER